MYLDQENFMKKGNTLADGVRVAVMPSSLSILPSEFGIDVLPDTKTSISLHNQRISRMAAPYVTNCTADWSETAYSDYNETDYSHLVHI